MGLNCTFDWEREKRIDEDLRNGECVFVGKGKTTVRYVGAVGEVLHVQKKREPLVTEDDLNFNSVLVAKAVEKAVEKCHAVNKTKKVEVKKKREPEANDVIRQIIHGETRGFDAVWRLVNANRGC
jgi:hypothetical protein